MTPVCALIVAGYGTIARVETAPGNLVQARRGQSRAETTRDFSDVLRWQAMSVNVLAHVINVNPMPHMTPWAEELARTLLQDALPRRWAHVQGVAGRARSIAHKLGPDADLVEAAAWLHDIGYLSALAATGMHQLDGARYLRDVQRVDDMLCRLVAHHSCAHIEADERGLAAVLFREFAPAPPGLASALTFSDMTTSPDGEPVSISSRIAEIHQRYGPNHLVSRFITRATPMLLDAVESVCASQARYGELRPAR
jgi:putative nucleotidyltransferase with HDIG domain